MRKKPYYLKFLESIFTAEPEHKISDQEKMLIEINERFK